MHRHRVDEQYAINVIHRVGLQDNECYRGYADHPYDNGCDDVFIVPWHHGIVSLDPIHECLGECNHDKGDEKRHDDVLGRMYAEEYARECNK